MNRVIAKSVALFAIVTAAALPPSQPATGTSFKRSQGPVMRAPNLPPLYQFGCRHYLSTSAPYRFVEIKNLSRINVKAGTLVVYTFSVWKRNDTQRNVRLPELPPNGKHTFSGAGLPFLANNQPCTVSVL